jgi:hypothetical protein
MTRDEAEVMVLLAGGEDPRRPSLVDALLALELAGFVRPALGTEPPTLTKLGHRELEFIARNRLSRCDLSDPRTECFK